ncbi:hypothetical protein scyTo_0007147 [Scyliorhinus torazame]|uniref:Cytochrome P450 n=1 Tax=Scyliorhinus torazame TaxID=75743 RepID=A0A401NM90_SCYTO|nr:hypothetical protein [Scyliorhinus torazame]
MDITACGVTLAALMLTVLLLLFSWKARLRHSRLPPGPPALPFLGNTLQIDKRAPDQSLIKMSKKYGSVFTVWLGPRPAVVLCGFETVKEALVTRADNFGARGTVPSISKITNGYGIASSNGRRSLQLRSFAITALRNFGKERPTLEDFIQQEAKCLVDVFRRTKELPFDPTFQLTCATANIMCAVVFGNRFEYTDSKLLTLLDMITENMRVISSPWGQLYDLLPSILDYFPGPHNRLFENAAKIKGFLREMIQSHKEARTAGGPQDFTASFLSKMEEEKGDPRSEFNDENLLLSTFNLFLAGTDTTSSTMRWGILLFLKFPEGMIVIPVLASVLYDSSCWESPETFSPDRFLDEKGRLKEIEAFMPFSAGNRMCIGEKVAQMQLFLFLTALLQSFTLRSPMDPHAIDISPLSSGFSTLHRPYQLYCVPRKSA